MKIFRFFAIALVAMLGLTACNKEPEHIYDDHSADLAGTWTCLQEGFAEALIIEADGSMVATGFADGKYWENVNGTITLKDGKATLNFEDDVTIEGHFDIIPGMAFSIVQDNGERVTFNYCKNDLADEVVGMWVCSDTPNAQENDMAIISYSEDGVSIFTGMIPNAESYMVTTNSSYNVVGDLMFQKSAEENSTLYLAGRLVYTPKGTSLGDIMTKKMYAKVGDTRVETTMSFLRIKQTLDLAEKKYDYIKTFVTNVKGLDKDIDFMGYTFNFAKMDGYILDKMLKTLLFTVEFPDANTIKYGCHYNNEPMAMEAPIAVDGNKMTVKMSEKNAAFRDIDLYTFQDQDNTQMHMYMPTYAFVNFFGNMQCTMMSQLGQLDLTDAAAVKAVYDSIDDAVETINVSFVMTKAAK